MAKKREVPTLLRHILEWDKKMTNNIVSAVIRRIGPIESHHKTLMGLEISCNGIIWLVACSAALFMTNNIYARHLFVNLLIALVFDIVVVAVTKASVRRRRPIPLTGDPFTIEAIDKFSFPSGHATRAAMVSALCSIQYDLFLLSESLLYFWFVAVCSCRILLRRHHLLDVAMGIVIGWLEALVLNFTGLWLTVDAANSFVAYFLDETYVGASYDV